MPRRSHPDQIVDNKAYKQFVKRFKQASAPASLSSVVNDWFDVGGGAEETFGEETVFSRVLASGDDALIDRALSVLTPWTPFKSNLAIREAVVAGNAEVLKRLLELGASPAADNPYVAHIAVAASHNSKECVDVLLEAGMSIEDRGDCDWTPLQWVAMDGNGRAVQMLLERGADPNALTDVADESVTAAQLAINHGHPEVAKLLSQAGAGDAAAADDIAPEAVREGILRARQTPITGDAQFMEEISTGQLQAAIEAFAQSAAGEEPLVLLASDNAGKSGFLFTDRAMYFKQMLASKPVRMEYGEITEISKKDDHLRISSKWTSLDWKLTESLLWETSRKRLADAVVTILQHVVQPEGMASEAAADATPEGPAAEAAAPQSETPAAKVTVEVEEPIDWPSVVAFHAPIVLLGMPIVMPALFALVGATDIAGDWSNAIGRLDYGQLLTLGAASLIPSMYAFGTRLQFSFGRFMAAAAIVAFASIQALTTALRSGSGPIPISLGGGLVGVAVAVALGGLGLALRNTLQSEAGRKRVKRIGATVVGVVLVGFGVIYYLEERETAANRARHERQVAQSHRYWPVLASSLPQDLPLLRRNIEAAPPDRILMWLTVADNDELKLTAFFSGVSPCVEVVSKSPIVREGLRSQLGTGAVTKSEGATTFEWNGQRGEIRACLGDADFEDTDDWPRQHEWYAEMFEPFVAAGRSG